MAPRRLPVLLALASLVLAGCVETPAEEAALVEEAEVAAEDGPATATAAAPNATTDLGHLPHAHDYWAGRDRVTLFEGTVEPTFDEAFEQTLVSAFLDRRTGAVGGAQVFLPDGAIVYEGTGFLELTPAWTDPRVTGLQVAWQDGDGPEWSAPVALENGKTLRIDVAPEMTDMPHMSKSRWAFRFTPEDPGAVLGPFDLRVDILRLRDIMEFPGHPDLFEGRPSKVLHDAPGRSAQVSYAKRVPNLALEGEFGEHWVVPQKVVPMETRTLQVDVTVTKAEASVGEVSEIRLYYSTADSRAILRAPPWRPDGGPVGGSNTWLLEVAPENTDTPYGKESQWRILVEAATTFADEARSCGGCVDTEIEFHLKVTAHDHEREGAVAGEPVGG